MASIWNRAQSRSNIHEFQDPEMSEMPRIQPVQNGRFFSWQRLMDAQTTEKEYFRVEETRPSYTMFSTHSLADVTHLRPVTPLFPLEEKRNRLERSASMEATPLPPATPLEDTSRFEDMQKRRQKWVYKYNI